MPAFATEENLSTGACTKPPTTPIGPFTSTTTFGGKHLQWRGETVYEDHKGSVTHHGARKVKDPGGSTIFFEGKPIAFVGDELDCHDTIAAGSGTSFGA